MSVPLLLGCKESYLGPWVPTYGREGVLTVSGLVEGHGEVVIQIRDVKEQEEDTFIRTDRDIKMKVDLNMSLVRAEVVKSCGSEVFIWLE